MRSDLNPVAVTTDYEEAALSNIIAYYPNTFMDAFSISAVHVEKIQGFELHTWYSNTQKALTVKSVQALAFLLVSNIANSFNAFVSSLDNKLMNFYLSYLATLKHRLVLYNVENDEDWHCTQ